MMKHISLLVLLTFGLSACGQSGPLYLPKAVAPPVVPASPPTIPPVATNTSATS